MTLKSPDVDKGSYKKLFEVLEKIFWPEANDTMSHFRFCTIKQKQGQSVDIFLTDFHLALRLQVHIWSRTAQRPIYFMDNGM